MQVSFGVVDGNQWEKHCQQLFRLKYEKNEYIEIPARFGGDLGLEGFTKTGEAFQCYCPDNEPTAKELYENQRDKVTEDIGKFIKNETNLKKLFGDVKIRRWYIVTPRYDNKDLIAICQKNAKLVRDKLCGHITKDFDVLIQTESDYLVELNTLNSNGYLEVDISLPIIPNDEISKWMNVENELYKTIYNKLNKIPHVKDIDKYVERNIRIYLQGQNMLTKLHKDYPDLYERLIKYKNAQASQVENESMIESDNPKEFLIRSNKDYELLIKENFGKAISHSTIKYLSQEAIADWLIRCPLDF